MVEPCHFVSRNVLCATSLKRLELALERYQWLSATRPADDTRFFLGGNVPFEKGGPTLPELMRRWLIGKKVTKDRISIMDSIAAFTEVEAVRRLAAQLRGQAIEQEIHFFSSPWHLWVFKTMWRAPGLPADVKTVFHSVRQTGGLKTKALYLGYAFVAKGALVLRPIGAWGVFVRFMNSRYNARREGFTWNGCA